jgi:hypothetical protein
MAIDAEIGHAPDQKSDNLSAAVTVAARRSGLKQIDHVVLSEDGSAAFAVQGELRSPTQQIAQPVDTTQAVQTSIAQSSASMAQVNQQQAQAPTAAQTTLEAQPPRSAAPLSR